MTSPARTRAGGVLSEFAEVSALARQCLTTPSKPGSRRVLAELTPNVKTPSKANLVKQKGFATAAKNPMKPESFPSRNLSRQLLGLCTGRKRSINEAYSVVACKRRQTLTSTTTRQGHHHPYGTSDFPDEQSARVARYAIFEGMDVLSTEEDTPDRELPQVTRESQDVPTERGPHSSLVICKNAFGSQSSWQSKDDSPSFEDNSSIKIKAEALRLRLQMAMYKVSTNQTCVPLSHLKIPAQPCLDRDMSQPCHAISNTSPSGFSATAMPSSQPSFSPLKRQNCLKDSSVRKQDVVLDENHRRIVSSAATVSEILPIPVFRPTPYSSCKISYPTPKTNVCLLSPQKTHITEKKFS